MAPKFAQVEVGGAKVRVTLINNFAGRKVWVDEDVAQLIGARIASSLSEKEKEQLNKQLEDLEKKLQNLAEQKKKEEQLKQLHKDGKLDAEALKRELDQLKKENEKLKNLNKLANKLAQCKQCMNAGETGKAANRERLLEVLARVVPELAR